MIAITDVSLRLGGALVLDQVSATLPEGGITALIGPNGAGKSTLLHLVARLRRLDTGTIMVDGLDVSSTATDRLALVLAVLPQATAVPVRLSVRDLVAFGRWPHHRGRPGPADVAAVDEAIGQFDLQDLAHRWLDELSGGQAQRAHVAMTCAQGTPWLLLDEPLAALDPRHAHQILDRLHVVAREGRSVVLVVHDLNLAAAWADHVVALKGGRLHAAGPAAEVMTAGILSDLYDTPIEVLESGGRRLIAAHGGPDRRRPGRQPSP